jgi:hypothetical protein
MSTKYAQLETRCALSVTPLQWAASKLKPSRIYVLHVGDGEAYYRGKDIAARAMERENPFSPYISLVIDVTLEPEEWYLKDEEGNACGSPGV